MLLAACVGATGPPRPAAIAPDAGGAAQADARSACWPRIRDWTLQGRVALSNGRDGGSGRIDWQQDGDALRRRAERPDHPPELAR